MKKVVSYLFLVLAIGALPLFGKWQGKVVYVVDGDTYWWVLSNYQEPAAAVKYKIRLYLMNCPEMDSPEGLEAKLYVSNIVYQQICTFETLYLDVYGRTVAIVTVGSNDLGAMITNAGMGVVKEKYKIKGK